MNIENNVAIPSTICKPELKINTSTCYPGPDRRASIIARSSITRKDAFGTVGSTKEAETGNFFKISNHRRVASEPLFIQDVEDSLKPFQNNPNERRPRGFLPTLNSSDSSTINFLSRSSLSPLNHSNTSPFPLYGQGKQSLYRRKEEVSLPSLSPTSRYTSPIPSIESENTLPQRKLEKFSLPSLETKIDSHSPKNSSLSLESELSTSGRTSPNNSSEAYSF